MRFAALTGILRLSLGVHFLRRPKIFAPCFSPPGLRLAPSDFFRLQFTVPSRARVGCGEPANRINRETSCHNVAVLDPSFQSMPFVPHRILRPLFSLVTVRITVFLMTEFRTPSLCGAQARKRGVSDTQSLRRPGPNGRSFGHPVFAAARPENGASKSAALRNYRNVGVPCCASHVAQMWVSRVAAVTLDRHRVEAVAAHDRP